MLTLLNAGLALVESIETLNEKESRSERKDILGKLVADLLATARTAMLYLRGKGIVMSALDLPVPAL